MKWRAGKREDGQQGRGRGREGRLTLVCSWNTFGCGLDGHIATSGCPSSSKLLSLKSSWPDSQLKINKFGIFLRKRLGHFSPSVNRRAGPHALTLNKD